MPNNTKIILCNLSHAKAVGQLVYALIKELYPTLDIDLDDYQNRSAKALAHPTYQAYALLHQEKWVGLISLNECCATYAGGVFGEIPEFYIHPDYRSCGYGEQLIAHVKAIGEKKQWPFIEVGAPSLNDWPRTIAFYQQNGFEEIGPRLCLDLA